MRRAARATAILTVTYLGVLSVGNTDSRRWLYLLVSLSAWIVFGLVARWFFRADHAGRTGRTGGTGGTSHGAGRTGEPSCCEHAVTVAAAGFSLYPSENPRHARGVSTEG